MSTGAVIFAFNNNDIDYVKLAAWSTSNINSYLDLPVSLITDATDVPPVFDKVITVPTPEAGKRWFDDVGATVEWRNTNRMDAFELSPYDTTLVLDADYVVGSSQLWFVLNEFSQDFLCYRNAYDLTGRIEGNMLNTFGAHNFPMSWATVMMFKRTHAAKMIFDSMHMIKNNWQHYRNIYKIDKAVYRNDYALSIALGIFSGHTNNVSYIWGNMPTITPDVKVYKIDRNEYHLDYIRNQSPTWLRIRDTDFHAMGKKHLEYLIDRS